MKLTLPLALCFLFIASSTATAQGLIAFPWLECPLVGPKGEEKPRCVWVTDAIRPTPIRPHESIEGNFQLDLLNPGVDPAHVVIQLRNTFGVFVREDPAVLPSGQRTNYPGSALALADRTNGIVIIRSDKPLLLWAWMFEQHMLRRGPASLDFPPESMSSQHIAVIPVDCSGENPNFAWVCTASEGPPPPQ